MGFIEIYTKGRVLDGTSNYYNTYEFHQSNDGTRSFVGHA